MISTLETEFKQTCRIIFAEELPGSLDDYGKWLGREVPLPIQVKSALSGKEVWAHPGQNYLKKVLDLERTIRMEEMNEVNETKLKPEEISQLSVREVIEKAVKPIAFYCGDFRYGEFQNIEKCSGAGGGPGTGGSNIYYCEDVYFGAKNIAYSNFASYSENLFGCNATPFSKFCIHAYNSSNVTRCFEIDGCTNSSDCYFCHNCEGMSNAILCFNAKNLRYAVGNVVVGPEQFARIKKMLLEKIVSDLKQKKTCDLDIYTVGCR